MQTQSSWLATETAPKDYPAYVVNALFVLQGGGVEGIPDDRFTNGGWGSTGALQVIGDNEKAFPTELRAEWFDLASRKGYKGVFPLPAEQLAGMMRQKYEQPDGEKASVDYLRVGFAPGGDVAVWVSARRVNHLVGMYKAAPAQIAVSAMSNDPADTLDQFVDKMLAAALPGERLQAVMAKPVPEGRWLQLDRRFPWQANVIGQFNGDVLWVDYANGEADWFDLSGKRPVKGSSAADLRTIPDALELSWSGPTGRRFFANVQFDQDEAVRAFGQMAAENPGAPMRLDIEPQDQGRQVGVYLRAGDSFYRFTKAKSGIWDK
ncbi:MAG: DUF2931 family protein [Novosphingobium sp.]